MPPSVCRYDICRRCGSLSRTGSRIVSQAAGKGVPKPAENVAKERPHRVSWDHILVCKKETRHPAEQSETPVLCSVCRHSPATSLTNGKLQSLHQFAAMTSAGGAAA